MQLSALLSLLAAASAVQAHATFVSSSLLRPSYQKIQES